MLRIDFTKGDHKIDWTATPEQEELARVYKQPLKRALAEEQAAKYRKDPDKYRSLESTFSLLEEGVYHPYLGAIGGGDTYIMHKTEDGYSVQYQYLQAEPIWLSEPLSISADGVYRVTPTGLGYIVKYEVDLTEYEKW